MDEKQRSDLADAGPTELLGRLTDDMSALVGQEIRLARAETEAAIRRAAAGATLVAAGGVAGGIGLLLVTLGACRALSRLLPEPLAYTVVGTAFLAGSGALGLAGYTELADLEVLPHTRQSLEETGRRLRSRIGVAAAG